MDYMFFRWSLFFSLISLGTSADAVDRQSLPNYVFTTEILAVDRKADKLIIKFSEAGTTVVKPGSILTLSNVDQPEQKFTVEIVKLHPDKPQAIGKMTAVQGTSIEKGQRYKSQALPTKNEPAKDDPVSKKQRT